MGYEVTMDNNVVGYLGHDGKMIYNKEKISEMIAGQTSSGKKGSKGFLSSVRVVYRWDRNRKMNNDAIYTLWKSNPLVQNRIRQLNALVFGRGLTFSYDDENTNELIKRFWRRNKLRQKLNSICTDTQLYGETFIALFPQPTGDVTISVFESSQVEIDFNPENPNDVNKYIVAYKDEEKNKDMTIELQPIEKYLNELEYPTGTLGTIRKTVNKVKRTLGLAGAARVKGKGVMIHVKFNNSSAEIHGTSDFRQVFQVLNEYMDFRGDRLAIHQTYGSPAWDISIDTDDPDVITRRIDELAGFTIGSNPVHNTKETWKPLEFNHAADDAQYDEKAMRGLICAGMGFPEHLLFNQTVDGNGYDDGTFALNKLAEDMQDMFGDAFIDMHKFVIAIGGGDIATIDEGEIIFPQISTMSEKAKAETYVLKVGAQICSRKTAALNTGHNWKIEEQQILEEIDMFGKLMGDEANGGRLGGRFSNRSNNQNNNRDDGSDDKNSRNKGKNIGSQTFGNRKTND